VYWNLVATTNGVFAFSSGKPCKDGKGNNKYGVRFLLLLLFHRVSHVNIGSLKNFTKIKHAIIY